MSSDKLLIDIDTLRAILADRDAAVLLYDRSGQQIPDPQRPELNRLAPPRVADIIGRSTLLSRNEGTQVWTCELEVGRSAYLIIDRDHLGQRPTTLIVTNTTESDERLLNALPIGILNLDARFEARQVNHLAATYLGADEAQLVGDGWQRYFADENLEGLVAHFRNPATAGRPYRQPMLLTRSGESPRRFDVVAVAQWQSTKTRGSYCVSIVELGGNEPTSERVAHPAAEDALNHLMSRRKFLATIDSLPERERRELGFACIDLDDFASINDRLGHRAGDELLRIVAMRLRTAVRDTDILARVGGDEMVVACRYVRQGSELAAFGRKLEGLLNGTVSVAGQDAHLGTSIGLAHGLQCLDEPALPGEGTLGFAETLLTRADAAMHQAKAEGKGQSRLYSRALNERIAALQAKQWEFQRVLDQDTLTCLFQFISGVQGPIALEALSRVNFDLSAHRGIEDLIETAKRRGRPWEFLDRMTRLAIDTYGHQRRATPKLGAVTLNANIDALQLLHNDFPARLNEWCTGAGVQPATVCLEIAETALETSAEDLIPVMQALRAAGFRLAMDDFGTGTTSIQHLLLYDFDQIKIDRYFIERALRSDKYRGLLHAMVAMGKSASIQMLAEGVESPDEEALCRAAGVEVLQGFHLGRPAPIEQLYPDDEAPVHWRPTGKTAT